MMTANETEPMPAEFFNAYLVAMLWAEVDPGTAEPLDETHVIGDIAPEAVERLRAEAAAFWAANAADLKQLTAEQAGHDFWLTRNGHGAGYWDRGLGDLGDRLSQAAGRFGELVPYIREDGMIDVM